MQKLNPLTNPRSINMMAKCIDCPYDDDDEFTGLFSCDAEPDVTPCLLQGNAAEPTTPFYGLGMMYSVDGGLRGPRLENDNGEQEYPTKVELYVRPAAHGPACIACWACYDEDGAVRMAEYSSYDDDGTVVGTYTAAACPDYCLTQTVEAGVAPPRDASVHANAPHQLVAATRGLVEMPCYDVIMKDRFDEPYNESVCQGHEATHAASVPHMPNAASGDDSGPDMFRVGGSVHRALFVAPVSANYTFNARFGAAGAGELWLSPNADPRFAQRVLSSTEPNPDAPAASANDDWECGEDGICYRAFGYWSHSWPQAQYACEQFGGTLAVPRSSSQNSMIATALSKSSYASNTWAWIGLNDRGMEGHWEDADGNYMGYADNTYDPDGSCTNAAATCADWAFESWDSSNPSDADEDEDCASYKSGVWVDNTCEYKLSYVCEIEGLNAHSSAPIAMKEGEARYFEFVGVNNAGPALSLLTLTILKEDADEAFITSEVLGLSGEFLREIRTDGPAIEVATNGFRAACGADETIDETTGQLKEGSGCVFRCYNVIASLTAHSINHLNSINFYHLLLTRPGRSTRKISPSTRLNPPTHPPPSPGTASTSPRS